MNYNYEMTQALMEGADLLYKVIQELIGDIQHLPGCRVTANIKRRATNIGVATDGVYKTMKKLAASAEDVCDECYDDEDDYGEKDVPTGSDLQEFLGMIEDMLASGKPVSISADIYISEGKDETPKTTDDTEGEE